MDMAFLARALAFWFLVIPFAPAIAADCDTLTRVNSIAMAPLPGGARMLVPVTLNGTPRNLLLGTGVGLSSLNQMAVQALGLSGRDTDRRLLDSAGNASRRYVHLSSFAIGTMHKAGADFMITPDRGAGTVDGREAGQEVHRVEVHPHPR